MTRQPAYELILSPAIVEELRQHLLGDRRKEQMSVVLCGVSRMPGRVRFLGRRHIPLPGQAFAHQSAGGLQVAPEVHRQVLQLAAREGLSQIDFHTHPGDGPTVGFSGIDDRHERELAAYLGRRLPQTYYGSVVLNGQAAAARLWEMRYGEPVPVALRCPAFETDPEGPLGSDPRFDRQVRAFGADFQTRLGALRVGVVGLGGLGSFVVEELARLGVRDWVLIDPDVAEGTNLNRLVGATTRDVEEERPKVGVAARTIRGVSPGARVKALRISAFAPRALAALKTADLLVAATDSAASRLVLNALAAQYLIPLVHIGVNLEADGPGKLRDVSGEVAIPEWGRWCLLCSGLVSAQQATMELAGPEERTQLAARGYLAGTPAPAVVHLNGLVASLAAAEIHNLIWPYKPLQRYLVYRGLEAQLLTIGIPSSGDSCLHCGAEGRLGLGDLAPVWRPDRTPGVPSLTAEVEEAMSSAMTNGGKERQP